MGPGTEPHEPVEETGRADAVPNGHRVSSPRRLLTTSLLLSAMFGLAHLLGYRESTGVFFGTADASLAACLKGGLYLVGYLSFVMLVPVLALATLILEGLAFWRHLPGLRSQSRRRQRRPVGS